MPLLVWANAATSALVVFGTPFIAGSQFLTLFDRVMGTDFFNPLGGGDVIMYQHIFWFYSHPAVYIMMLPGFGIVSEVLATHARKPIFGYRALAFSTVAIAVLGFGVWVDLAEGVEAGVRGLVGLFGVVSLVLAVVNAAKQKFGVAALGLVVLPVGVAGALRLARPRSLWARSYGEQKLARARARFGPG